MYKTIKERSKHVFILLYSILYLGIFFLLEQNIKDFHIINFKLDEYVPFMEIFIVPYLLWFAYVAITVVFFFLFLDIGEYYRLVCYLFLGMTVFLIVSFVYPNGLNLRPNYFPRDNIFTDMVRSLYQTDTSTNVMPSIHVYNSICVHLAIAKSPYFQKHKSWKHASLLLMLLIILSTVFIKQHSLLDVAGGILLAAAFYPLFYIKNWIPYRSQFPLPEEEKKVPSTLQLP